MNIKMRPLESLMPYVNNPRKNDHGVEQFAESIREFGFRVPILIRSTGEVIDGHFRLKAAKIAGLAEVPTILADDMSEAQVKAFRIAVNKMAELAQWDMKLLKGEMDALQALDFDLALTGFSEVAVGDLLGIGGDPERDDNVPDLNDKKVSSLGDVWILGKHRLMCGDAKSMQDMTTLMGSDQADMVFVDPPYNVDYEGKAGKIKNDKMSPAKFHAFLQALFAATFDFMRPGAPIYVCHADAGEAGVSFRQTFMGAGFKLSSCLVWCKDQFVLGRCDYHWQHEPILYGWKPGRAHSWYGGRKNTTIHDFCLKADQVQQTGENEYQIKIGDDFYMLTGTDLCLESLTPSLVKESKPIKSDLHPTMKPVALVERFIINSSSHGDVVLDACGGSGTTMIACEKRARCCRVMELDPKYVDVEVRRWQEFSGSEAIHEQSGKSFTEKERQP